MSLSTEIKKLQRPFEQFDAKLRELTPYDTKLNKTFSDIELQLTMVSIVQQQHTNHLQTIKESINNENNKDQDENLENLRRIASLAREKANEQESISKEFSKRISAITSESKSSNQYLNTLLNNLTNISPLAELEYESLSKESNKLVAEAAKVKAEMDNRVIEAKIANQELSKIKINEDEYKNEIEDSSKNIENINSQV